MITRSEIERVWFFSDFLLSLSLSLSDFLYQGPPLLHVF